MMEPETKEKTEWEMGYIENSDTQIVVWVRRNGVEIFRGIIGEDEEP